MNIATAFPFALLAAVAGVAGGVWLACSLREANKRVDRAISQALRPTPLPPAEPGFLARPADLPAADVDATIAALEAHANQQGGAR